MYALTLYLDPARADAMGAEPPPKTARGEVFTDWPTCTRAMHEAGVLVAGEGLLGPEATTAVRVVDGETLLTDGPFVEAKELLIGFYLLDVADLDAALDWAARIPNVTAGTVEVRPVMAGDASALKVMAEA